MTQRTWAGLLAVPLLLALWVVALVLPLPFVTYEPGLTVDILDDSDGKEIIQVDGHKTYRDDGELRLTTVYVSRPESRVNLFQVMEGWISDDDAVYPRQVVYPKGETNADTRKEGAIEMVASQDSAIAVALSEMGVDYETFAKIVGVEDGTPAAGKIEEGDRLVSVNGRSFGGPDDVRRAVSQTSAGEAVELGIVRAGKERTVTVTPEVIDGVPRVGIEMQLNFRFPFDVEVGIDDRIGGPSAGLMFALGIYDTLTPGSLTGGNVVAGTGEITPEGTVVPIGGIQQKIAGAREAGADLFLVPAANCREALGVSTGQMELVRASTMHDVVEALDAWVDDPNHALPSCARAAS
jgi:Lon-like protease